MTKLKKNAVSPPSEETETKPMRADARLKMGAVVQAAIEVFANSGVDAPVREIAEKAGVGLGTVYRHFPQRSDLIVAVMQTQVDACSSAATMFLEKYGPDEALARWLHRLMDFFKTKRGLAAALHSGNPAYSALPGYFMQQMGTALEGLIEAAVVAKAVRPGIEASDLLRTVASLCHGPNGEEPVYAREMVDLLVDGLRYGVNGQRRRSRVL